MVGDEMRQLSKSILLEEWLDTSFKTDGLCCAAAKMATKDIYPNNSRNIFHFLCSFEQCSLNNI